MVLICSCRSRSFALSICNSRSKTFASLDRAMARLTQQASLVSLALMIICILVQGSVTADDNCGVWPVPRQCKCTASNPRKLDAEFSIFSGDKQNPTLVAAMSRYQSWITQAQTASDAQMVSDTSTISGIAVSLDSVDETLGNTTSFNYKVELSGNTISLAANNVYGAIAGLETLSQMLQDGSLSCSSLSITDSPTYGYRALMLDVANRYLPMRVVQNVIDGMTSLKMNVLNFRFSGYGAARVDSDTYQDVTAGVSAYSTGAVSQLVEYARQRGVRVVPQMDFPARASGFTNTTNVTFCENNAQNATLSDDDNTLSIIKGYISNVTDPSVFGDYLVHLGGSNMSAVGKCSVKQVQNVLDTLVTFTKGNNRSVALISDAISATTPKDVVAFVSDPSTFARQDMAVVLSSSRISDRSDVTLPLVGTETFSLASGYIDFASKASNLSVAGVCASFFTQLYCNTTMCGAVPPKSTPAPAGAQYAPRLQDPVIELAVTSAIFPRISATAGAAWNYVSMTDAQVTAAVTSLAKLLAQRDVPTCGNGTSSDESLHGLTGDGSCDVSACTAVSNCEGSAYPLYVMNVPTFQFGFSFGVALAATLIVCVGVAEFMHIRQTNRKGFTTLE
eukprot:m.355519 g.355519  ORF g.355519 m.355519 type:complete len:620 (+) comp17271_c0_seq1:114-1973(+)